MTTNKINPEHYQSDTNLEAIDVIEAFDLNFHRGNIVKYVLRAGKKTEKGYENKEKQLEDLNKVVYEISDIEFLCKKNPQIAKIIFLNFFSKLCKKANNFSLLYQ